MPLSDTHRRKRAKNFFALGALLVFVAGLFYLSVLKTQAALTSTSGKVETPSSPASPDAR